MKAWRIVLRVGWHWAVCAGCGWTCPKPACCGSVAVNAAGRLHTNCRAQSRAA